jgi:hypothetical protein
MHDFRATVRALQILDRSRLDDALGTRWALLRVAGLNQIRQLHPRLLIDDLIVDKINWSAVLDASASGLKMLPQISRHADAWADEAARKPETFNAFSSWHGFLGTTEQEFIDKHIRDESLAIRNARNIPLCAYQIYSELMESESAAQFNASLRLAGCSFKPLDQTFFKSLRHAVQ